MITRNNYFATISLLLLALLLFIGCKEGYKYPLGKVEGVVWCDEEPVQGATVYLVPLQTGDTALVGKSGQGITDENGKFCISTYDPGDGAVIGKHAVRVGPSISTPSDTPAFLSNTNVVTQVEVKKGKNEFQIEVPLRHPRYMIELPEGTDEE